MINNKSSCDINYPPKVEESECEMPAADYVRMFRDPERFIGYCRQCGSYGRTWRCPPLADEQQDFSQFTTVRIFAVKVTPVQKGLPLGEAFNVTRATRVRLERKLLGIERECGGRAYLFSSTEACPHCPEGCTRPEGKPCRHPELTRPSLEAAGFDLGRTVSELFGFDLAWGRDGCLPEYLTLVGAVFIP